MFEGLCVVARVNSGILPLAKGGYARGAIEGYPDIVLLYNGKFYGIEVKSSTGRQSNDQKRMQQWITEAGGIYILTRSLQDIKQIFKKNS